eukprot:355293-Chlamydomonas_euryale.AAC.4
MSFNRSRKRYDTSQRAHKQVIGLPLLLSLHPHAHTPPPNVCKCSTAAASPNDTSKLSTAPPPQHSPLYPRACRRNTSAASPNGTSQHAHTPTPAHIPTHTQVQHYGGFTLSALLACLIVAMGVLFYTQSAGFGGGGDGTRARKLRSTDYVD